MSDVPQLSLVTPADEEVSVDRGRVRKSDSCHIDLQHMRKSPEARQQEELDFLLKTGVGQYFNFIIDDILREQPEDPLNHFSRSLRRGGSLEESAKASIDVHPMEYLKKLSLECEKKQYYLQLHGIFGVFEELISSVIRDKPADVLAYTLSWLRFNGKHVEDAAKEPEGTPH